MALSSMTGFGRAVRAGARLAVEVEARSVNARHLDLRCRLPSEWARLEPKLEALVRKAVRRGHVELSVRVKLTVRASRPRIDEGVLALYERAAKRHGGAADGASLLRLPGVVTLEESPLPARAGEQAVLAAARDALAALSASRREEGQRLAAAMEREMAALQRQLLAIGKRVPVAVQRQHAALRQRLDRLLGEGRLPADDPGLAREVALLADRADVTEELDRLASHLAAVRARLQQGGPVGREVEFLLQEVGREANTLASKANDAQVAERAVHVKTGVERLREQAANIE